MKKTILTGLKPTGSLTLGNYIGSIKQMIEMQDDYKSYLFIADMHAITVPTDSNELHKNIRDFIALYLACGIDPKKNVLYLQSDIEYIPSISWLLECNTYYGELSRMIQFKEKSKKNANFSVGLLTYPVLMATDILVVDADYVPVGIDQRHGFAFGIIDLGNRWWRLTQELRVVELMTTVFLAIERKLPIPQ